MSSMSILTDDNIALDINMNVFIVASLTSQKKHGSISINTWKYLFFELLLSVLLSSLLTTILISHFSSFSFYFLVADLDLYDSLLVVFPMSSFTHVLLATTYYGLLDMLVKVFFLPFV